MTETDNWLQQIAESPEDRTLRLVFADWLQDAGDPRAEQVRADDFGGFPLLTVERPVRFRKKWETLLPEVELTPTLQRPLVLLKTRGDLLYRSQVAVRVDRTVGVAARFGVPSLLGRPVVWASTGRHVDSLVLHADETVTYDAGNGVDLMGVIHRLDLLHYFQTDVRCRVRVEVSLERYYKTFWTVA